MATFGTFVAGQVLTAAELNGAGAWQDYTPSWTQSATISKTVNWARYTQLNKLVMGTVKMTATSAGTANNKVLVGLPVTASSNNFVIGTMSYFDTGATNPYYVGNSLTTFFESSTTMSFSWVELSGGSVASSARSGDVRFGQTSGAAGSITVASGDIIYVQFAYEAA